MGSVFKWLGFRILLVCLAGFLLGVVADRVVLVVHNVRQFCTGTGARMTSWGSATHWHGTRNLGTDRSPRLSMSWWKRASPLRTCSGARPRANDTRTSSRASP